MINSTELITNARKALQRMLERCVERNSTPSYTEIYYEGYMDGFYNAKDMERIPVEPLTDWHYIELEGNPQTDDMCFILCQFDAETTIRKGWYEKDKDEYELDGNPIGVRKILAWHMLPIRPEDYQRYHADK